MNFDAPAGLTTPYFAALVVTHAAIDSVSTAPRQRLRPQDNPFGRTA
jgi:hypothetical protein